MSKSVARLKSMKKVADKINHSSKLRTDIPAGMAAAGPPLGPMLGQRNINVAAFCKDFNEKTANIKPGIPLPTRVKVNPDRSYQLVIHQPPASYFLKQAAGVSRGAMEPACLLKAAKVSNYAKIILSKAIPSNVVIELLFCNTDLNLPKYYKNHHRIMVLIVRETCGKITLKHLYEIAKIKAQDPPLEWKSLKEICTMLIATARTCGIEVVKELDAKEYGEFLKERKAIVEDQKKLLQEKREAKMLRTA